VDGAVSGFGLEGDPDGALLDNFSNLFVDCLIELALIVAFEDPADEYNSGTRFKLDTYPI